MGSSLNDVKLGGQMATAPKAGKSKYTNKPMAKFRISVYDHFKRPSTMFVDAVAYRNQARRILKYFPKGTYGIFEGHLSVYRDAKTDKDVINFVVESSKFFPNTFSTGEKSDDEYHARNAVMDYLFQEWKEDDLPEGYNINEEEQEQDRASADEVTWY